MINTDKPVRVSLDSILKQGTVNEKRGHLALAFNFLLDHEIGKLKLTDFNARPPGKQFHIIAMADPQGGDAFAFDNLRTRMRIHNAFIQESVALVNRLPIDPLFSVVIGDIVDAWGYPEDFEQMRQYLQKLDMPVLYELGNHETENKSPFSPGYNMKLFDNYFAAQKRMNGTENLLYSFDAGDWHFIVWPDPLRDEFWETHPHYFEWLKQDLEAHQDMPVMVFQHVPSHPMGINPLINYCESVSVKRLFLDTLAEHGNVKYVLSGHVHIPVRASFKTAVSYKGMNLINLPAAGYRPRAFGESDWYGGPSQGVAVIEFNGRDAEITFKCVTGEEYTYPQDLPEFDEKRYPLWLNPKWDLAAEKQVVNGDFTDGLSGWKQRYVYMEDENPSNICEVRAADREHLHCLYLYSRCRGYQAPGQDRWPQALNKAVQAIRVDPGETPLIELDYKLDKEHCDFNGVCGAYVWIEGFEGSVKLLNMVYSLHWMWYNMGGKAGLLRTVPPVQMDLNAETGRWHHAVLNPKHDDRQFNENEPFDTSGLDRLVISIGTWNINDGDEQPFAVYINRVQRRNGSVLSSVNGVKLQPKPKEKQWWRSKLTPFTHTAGEHRYVLEMDRNYKPEQE
ncbi:MAG: metallophosphoesterase [candidate division KSB1 bacterium]|nr:metallophosphoesterase [candidate division KSB1 bacterium]